MQLRNRKRVDTNTVPAEIQEYYNAEQRERVGLAWIIAIVSLVVSLAVIFGIFFGGRYIYRTYIHKPKSTSKPLNDTNKKDSPAATSTDDSNKTSGDGSNSVTQPSSQSPAAASSASPDTSNSSTTIGQSLVRTGPDSTEE